MKSQHPTMDELLSGMLDGVLSDDEVRRLEVAMLEDPTLGKRLEDLSRLRRELLSGRTRSSLGAGFASKVLKRSQERALEMGSDCPAWLSNRQDEVSRPHLGKTRVADRESKRLWIYGGVLASAAVFALVYASLPSRDAPNNLAESPGQENRSAPKEMELGDNILSLLSEIPPDSASEKAAAPEDSVAKKSMVDSIARGEPSNTALLDNKPVASDFVVDSLAENSATVGDLSSKAEPNQNKNKLDSDLSPQKWFALVIDISIDQVAIENQSLVSILKQHGVVYADDLSIDAELLAALEESQLIGRTNAAESEKMGVMFVRAPIDKLSLAIEEISDRYKDFPAFEMDLAYDSSIGLLIKQLSGIKVAEEKNGIVLNLAPPKSPTTSLPFTASVPKPGMFSRESMKKGTSKLFPEPREMAYLLLRFRAAK